MKIGIGLPSVLLHLQIHTKEVNILNSSKEIQEVDLSVKLLKDNKNFFAAYITRYLNDFLKSPKLPNCLKLATIISVFKKNAPTSKNNYRPVNALFVTNFRHFLKTFFQSLNVVSVRTIACNIACS